MTSGNSLTPKLHKTRCLIMPENFHISKSNKKNSKKFRISINSCPDLFFHILTD